MSEYFTKTGGYTPNTKARGTDVGGDFDAVSAGFDKLPTLSGNGGKVLSINAGGTAIVVDGVTVSLTEINRLSGVSSGVQSQLDLKAPLASPALTGTPTAPTAAASTSTTQVATTAMVQSAIASYAGTNIGLPVIAPGDALKAIRLNSSATAFEYFALNAYAAISASDIDVAAANYFSKTISGTTTFTVSNVPSSGTVAAFVLELTNGGSATINWWSGVKWPAGIAPTLTTAGRDVLGFYTRDGGTTWTGMVMAKDAK